MYDNPIYRWRISIAVALSELHRPPLDGYVAYRSIVNYLNQHGLALMDGEASPMPSYEAVKKLIYDPERLERLFQKASAIPIDYNLPAVPIIGSEKGEAAYYYWAFRLFGIHLSSLWYFYFFLLALSVAAFFLTFWRHPFCILLLMLYLVGHFFMVDVASGAIFQTVHNSRFLPVLSLLPSIHLSLLALIKAQPRPATVAMAIFQGALLYFVIFNRIEAAWQVVAILTVTIIAASFSRDSFKLAISVWPGMLVILGAATFVTYEHVALDHAAYAIETRNHTFWDPVLSGTISASPELTKLYGLGQPPFSDTMGYMIARKFLIDHNDTNSPIAEVKNGVVVGSFAMRNMGAYDEVLRKAFFEIVRKHPWLVAWSIFYQKPRVELTLLADSDLLRRSSVFLWCIFLSIGSGVAVSVICAPTLQRTVAITAGLAGCASAILSLATVFIFPSIDVPDTILLLLLLLFILVAIPPLFLVRRRFETTFVWSISKHR